MLGVFDKQSQFTALWLNQFYFSRNKVVLLIAMEHYMAVHKWHLTLVEKLWYNHYLIGYIHVFLPQNRIPLRQIYNYKYSQNPNAQMQLYAA